MSIAGAWLAREVEIRVRNADGSVTGGVYLVPLPSARHALALLEMTGAAAGGDEDAWYAVAATLRQWLPFRLSSLLLSERVSRADAMTLAVRLLTIGIEDLGRHEEDVERTKRRAQEIGWHSIIADYRSTIGGTLDEPWSFFVAQCRRLPEIRAKQEVSWISAYAIAKTGEGYKDLLQRAGYTAQEIEEMSEEEQKRQILAWEMQARAAGVYVGGSLDHLVYHGQA